MEDFDFIHEIALRPENAGFIIDEDNRALQAHLDSADAALVIWENDKNPAGFALFCELSNPANRAELRRLGLQKTSTGLGPHFLQALVGYAFDMLQIDRLWLDVAGDNPRARKTYERAGFTYEGRLRQHWKRPAGDLADLDLFAMLRSDRLTAAQTDWSLAPAPSSP